MDIDTNRVRDLLAKRDEIDGELAEMFTGSRERERKPINCGTCGQSGHSARSCPQRTKPE